MAERTWVDDVKERVERQLDRPLRISELAREAGVHRVHLGRVFRERFGEPLGAFHRRLRIERAARELREGDHSISEVAHRCGFADQAHFGRMFKRLTGRTPDRYREEGRGWDSAV